MKALSIGSGALRQISRRARRNLTVHDAVCIAVFVDLNTIETKQVNVVIETIGQCTIGRTVVDHGRRPPARRTGM